MLRAGVLTFQEFQKQEPLPLAIIHNAVLEFLQDRNDTVVFGAQAVNAYVQEPRMTQGFDLVSVRAADLARELQEYLSKRFHIAVRLRTISEGQGYRLYDFKFSNPYLVE